VRLDRKRRPRSSTSTAPCPRSASVTRGHRIGTDVEAGVDETGRIESVRTARAGGHRQACRCPDLGWWCNETSRAPPGRDHRAAARWSTLEPSRLSHEDADDATLMDIESSANASSSSRTFPPSTARSGWVRFQRSAIAVRVQDAAATVRRSRPNANVRRFRGQSGCQRRESLM